MIILNCMCVCVFMNMNPKAGTHFKKLTDDPTSLHGIWIEELSNLCHYINLMLHTTQLDYLYKRNSWLLVSLPFCAHSFHSAIVQWCGLDVKHHTTQNQPPKCTIFSSCPSLWPKLLLAMKRKSQQIYDNSINPILVLIVLILYAQIFITTTTCLNASHFIISTQRVF